MKHKWSKICQHIVNGCRVTVEVPFSKEEWHRKHPHTPWQQQPQHLHRRGKNYRRVG